MGGLRNPLAGGVFGGRGSTYAGADQGDILNRIFRPGTAELEVSGSGIPITERGNASFDVLTQQKMLQELQREGMTQAQFDQLGNSGMSIQQIYSTLLGGAGSKSRSRSSRDRHIWRHFWS